MSGSGAAKPPRATPPRRDSHMDGLDGDAPGPIPDAAIAPAHMLLTVLGTDPKPARYTLEGREAEAQLAPIALLDLLPKAERPDTLLAICTPEAERNSWPLLKQALNGRCRLKPVRVTAGEDQREVAACLEKISAAVPANVALTVDVTHGFRHLSFLTYIAVLYLSALRGVQVRRACYGLLNRDRPSPFLDLRPILNLPGWIHALRVLRETGSAMPMAELLRDGSQSALTRDLSLLSQAYLSGLPIELGRQAHGVRRKLKSLKKALARDHRLPLARELVEQLDGALAGFAFDHPPSGQGWKRRVALSEGELARQARMIDDLLERGSVASAIGLMREWTASWVALRCGWQGEWLDFHRGRRKATGLLGAIAAVGGDRELEGCLTEQQRQLGLFWRNLTQLRNGYHHHGMRAQPLIGEPQTERAFAAVREYWGETLRHRPQCSLPLGAAYGKTILVSPIGNRPGVLSSALHACREGGRDLPDLCLVVCSRESEGGIRAAADEAGYAGAVEPLRIEDPHGGFGEIEPLAKAARPRLIGAHEVLVNVTGGTTLMGLAVEALATAARDLACPSVRRFGLVDRRPPAQQDEEPYRVGEPFWLDRAEAGDAD